MLRTFFHLGAPERQGLASNEAQQSTAQHSTGTAALTVELHYSTHSLSHPVFLISFHQ